MRTKFIVYIIIFFVILGLWYQEAQEQKRRNSEQEVLLEQIQKLGHSEISRLEISLGHIRQESTTTKVFGVNDIQKLQNQLKSADTGRARDHNRTLCECTLTFQFNNGESVVLLGTVYEKNANDVFLDDNLFTRQPDGSWRRSYKEPIRVANLGKWLLEHGPQKE